MKRKALLLAVFGEIVVLMGYGCGVRHYHMAGGTGDVTHAPEPGARIVVPDKQNWMDGWRYEQRQNRQNWMEKAGIVMVSSRLQPYDGCLLSDERVDGFSTWACPEQTVKVTTIGGCDESLWSHVYHPDRLQVHNRCTSVTGVIVDATHGRRKDGVRKEADGDTHGWLRLDPGQEQYLNQGNMSDEEGNLVYEVVCHFPVHQADAVDACRGYKSPVKLAPVGSHVRITGSWVMDDNHAKWNEIHPVSSIDVLK